MELTVVNTKGVPESGIISIRAGATRRQAQLSTLDRPLKFPTAPEDCTTFKVDVLALLASGRLAYVPEENTYSLALDPPSGEGDVLAPAEPIEVAFQVNPMQRSSRNASPDNPKNASWRTDSPGPTEILDEREVAANQRKEESAKSYLEKHGLTKFMQFLMQSLMKDKPADPYSFLHKQITKRLVVEMSRSEDGYSGNKSVDALLAKLGAPGEHPPGDISTEQLQALEQEAEAAAEQLRADNARLRETCAQLRANYGQLEEEGATFQAGEVPEDENPHVQVYSAIANMQDEISFLANDNQKLIEELFSMKWEIESFQPEPRPRMTLS